MNINKLQPIFTTLQKHNITPIIVGGWVRDMLLGIESKDIDIELYNVNNFAKLEEILQKFGSCNIVGKQFGVLKLTFQNLELDFSLPRTESKIGIGHKGFSVTTYKQISFKEAALRRDFTINAMGYNPLTKELLDPFGGKKDLENKTIQIVNKKTFVEDPLRVLRGVGFCVRLKFKASTEFIHIAQTMVQQNMLQELPKERIFEELKKVFLKANNFTTLLPLARAITLKHFFHSFKCEKLQYKKLLYALKNANKLNKEQFSIFLALLLHQCSKKKREIFFNQISNQTKLLLHVEKLLQHKPKQNYTTYELYTLAQEVILEELFLLFTLTDAKNKTLYKEFAKQAKQLGILKKKLPPIIEGKDLLKLGLKPSKEFKIILEKCYEAQKKGVIHTKEEGVEFVKSFV